MIILHLPEPVGWIALTPEALREAQSDAAQLLGATKNSGEAAAARRDLVSADQAARELGVEASWLMRQARMRKVPFHKVGKYSRFDVDALRAHLVRGPLATA
jgi:hypothetical protein